MTQVVKEFYIQGQNSSLTWVYLKSVAGAQGPAITLHSLLLTMKLPPLVTPVRVSKKSGKRRYGIAGPKKKKHTIQNVPRGVTPAEADRILKHLEARVVSFKQQMHLT